MTKLTNLRERRRREFVTEIGTVTRELVVDDGLPAVTMAAVADRMGVTAPALYRYVDGRNGLLELACATVVTELTAHLRDVRDRAGADPLTRLLELFRELRRWSLDHRAEFALVFAHPTSWLSRPDPASPTASSTASPTAGSSATAEAVAADFELVWLFEAAMFELWRGSPFPVPADDELAPDLRDRLSGFMGKLAEQAAESGVVVDQSAPIGAAAVFLDYWVRVYGMISMEVFGHLAFSVEDAGPLLEYVLDDFTRTVTGSADRPQSRQ